MVTATKKYITAEDQSERFNRCITDIFTWLTYVKIKDETTNQLIQFQVPPHTKYLISCLLLYKQVALLKAKQVYCSWTAAAFHVWKCYRPYTNILCLSRGKDEAADLLDKSRFINEHLPDWLKLRVGHDGREYMSFPDTMSRILALPSTEDAGVGYTATHVTRDEVEFHDFAEENYGHVKPTVDAGASILDMSTSKRSRPQSHFKMLFRRAMLGENNYKALFFPYYCRPGRDAEWYVRTMRDYWPRWIGEQDYPRTIEDALGSVEGEGLFDKSSIDRLLREGQDPLEIQAGSIYIFHRAVPKIKYYAGGDAAEGRGGNNGVIWIQGEDGFNKELCAIMCSNHMTPDIFAFHAHQLLCQYGRPFLVMGGDAWGQMVLENLKALGYGDKIYCSASAIKKGKLGLMEAEDNKQMKLMRFALDVRDGLRIRFKLAIDEMSGWILDDKGRYSSTFPTDDCIIAGANAVIARENSLTGEYVICDRL